MNDQIKSFPMSPPSTFEHILIMASQLVPVLALVAALIFILSVLGLAFKTRESGRFLLLAGTFIAVAQLARQFFFPLADVGEALAYVSMQRLLAVVAVLLISAGIARLTWSAVKRSNTTGQ